LIAAGLSPLQLPQLEFQGLRGDWRQAARPDEEQKDYLDLAVLTTGQS
jgi:hypothetical protein